MVSLFMSAALLVGTCAMAQGTTSTAKSSEKAKTEVKAAPAPKAACDTKTTKGKACCKATSAEKPAAATQTKTVKK